MTLTFKFRPASHKLGCIQIIMVVAIKSQGPGHLHPNHNYVSTSGEGTSASPRSQLGDFGVTIGLDSY